MKTIKDQFRNEIEIKKSKFITYLLPVDSEKEVQTYLNKYKELEASHNCYAYKIGLEEKAFDDGEPSSTAGKPILNVIKKQGLDHLLILVIRYFGGIKLGAGGLTRAYSDSASEALLKATIITKELGDQYLLSFDYHYLKKINHILESNHILIEETNYDLKVQLTILLRDTSILDMIKEYTNRDIEIKHLGQKYLQI